MAGSKNSGARPADPVEDERQRKAGETAMRRWWVLFLPWLRNHMNEPVYTLEAAFMDGYRQGRKEGYREGSARSFRVERTERERKREASESVAS